MTKSLGTRTRGLRIPGDANRDDRVDAADLNIIGLNWRGTEKTWVKGDFTGDGLVDAADLNVLALNWRYGVETPEVLPMAAPLGDEPPQSPHVSARLVDVFHAREAAKAVPPIGQNVSTRPAAILTQDQGNVLWRLARGWGKFDQPRFELQKYEMVVSQRVRDRFFELMARHPQDRQFHSIQNRRETSRLHASPKHPEIVPTVTEELLTSRLQDMDTKASGR